MSYATMDHAKWVERNIPFHKEAIRKRRPKRTADGIVKGWHAAPDKLSPFQARVMDILGMTFGGIYNAPLCWDAIEWKGWGGDAIGVPIKAFSSLATYDGGALTRLVLLCHEARIRCEIRPHGWRMLMIAFRQRTDTGSMGAQHPNVDEMVAAFRDYLPPRHRIIYSRDPDEPVQELHDIDGGAA